MTKVKISEIIPTRTSVIIDTKEQFDKVVKGLGMEGRIGFSEVYTYYRFYPQDGYRMNDCGIYRHSLLNAYPDVRSTREIHFSDIDFEQPKQTRYICPRDYYGGQIKKGDVVEINEINFVSYHFGNTMFPAEIVEQWEPEQPRITIPSGEYTRDQLESFIQQLK